MSNFWRTFGQIASGLSQVSHDLAPLFQTSPMGNPIIPDYKDPFVIQDFNSPSKPPVDPGFGQPPKRSVDPYFDQSPPKSIWEKEAEKRFGPNDSLLRQWGFYGDEDPHGFKQQFPGLFGGTEKASSPLPKQQDFTGGLPQPKPLFNSPADIPAPEPLQYVFQEKIAQKFGTDDPILKSWERHDATIGKGLLGTPPVAKMMDATNQLYKQQNNPPERIASLSLDPDDYRGLVPTAPPFKPLDSYTSERPRWLQGEQPAGVNTTKDPVKLDNLGPVEANSRWLTGQGQPVSVPMGSVNFDEFHPLKLPKVKDVFNTAYGVTGEVKPAPQSSVTVSNGQTTLHTGIQGPIQFDRNTGNWIANYPVDSGITVSNPTTKWPDGPTYGNLTVDAKNLNVKVNPVTGQYEISGQFSPKGSPSNTVLDNFDYNVVDKADRPVPAQKATEFMNALPGTKYSIHGRGSAPFAYKGRLDDLSTQEMTDLFGAERLQKHPLLNKIYQNRQQFETNLDYRPLF